MEKTVITVKQYKKYHRTLFSDFPLVGLWLRRSVAKQLAAALIAGSVGASKLLAEALASHKDSRVKTICAEAFMRLEFSGSIDVFCEYWLKYRAPVFEDILIEKGYVAQQPARLKVFSALKTGKLKEIISMGGSSVPPLVEACSDADETISDGAARLLGCLENPAAIETFCEYLMEHDDPQLNRIAASGDYAPFDEATRALFYFLTGQWELYEILDFQAGRPLLRKGFLHGSEGVKKRFLTVARRSGKSAFVSEVLVGGEKHRRTNDMGFSDWEDLVSGLIREKQWEELWKLLFIGPATFAPRILKAISYGTWQPPERDKNLFAEFLGLCMEDTLTMSLVSGVQFMDHTTHIDLVNPLVSIPRQKMFAGGSASTIRLWSLPSGEHVKTLHGHKWTITSLLVSGDEQMLVSSSKDRTVRLWSLPGGKHVKTLEGHKDWVTCLALTPDGRTLISGSRDSTIRLWGFPGGNHLKTLVLDSLEKVTSWVLCFCMHPGGKVLAAGSKDSTVRLWSIPGGEHLKTLKGHMGGVQCLSKTPDGKILVSGGKEGTIRFWDFNNGSLVKKVERHEDAVMCLETLMRGKIIASGGKDGIIQLWELPGGDHVKALKGHTGSILSLVASPDGCVLASASSDSTIRIWNVADGKLLKVLKGHTDQVRSIAISPDTRIIASGSNDKTLKFWELSQAKPLALADHEDLNNVRKIIMEQSLDAKELQEWKLLEAILKAKFRYDIMVEERVISLGAYDIEIDVEV